MMSTSIAPALCSPWILMMLSTSAPAHAVQMSEGSGGVEPIFLQYAPLPRRSGWFEPKKLRWHAIWHRSTPFANNQDHRSDHIGAMTPSPVPFERIQDFLHETEVNGCQRLKGGGRGFSAAQSSTHFNSALYSNARTAFGGRKMVPAPKEQAYMSKTVPLLILMQVY